jgi:hypothetical protein
MRRRFTGPLGQTYNTQVSNQTRLSPPAHRSLRTGASTALARPFPPFGDRVNSATVSLLAMPVVAAIEA